MNKMIAAILALGFGFSAHSLTLAEKKQLEKDKKALAAGGTRTYDKFKTKCGYPVDVAFDEAMVVPFLAENTSLDAYCDTPRSVLADMCEDATSKAEIVKKIKKITCKNAGKPEVSMKLSGTTLEYTVGVGASNLDEKAKEWFEKNL